MTSVVGKHSNSYNPYLLDQFILCRTCDGQYKRCNDNILEDTMMHLALNIFVNASIMIEVSSKASPKREDMDICMINNVRLRPKVQKNI